MFTQFTGGALRGHWDMTVVSLVGFGSGDQGRASQGREQREVVSYHEPEASHGTASPAAQSEIPAERGTIQEGASLPGIRDGNKAGTGDFGDTVSSHEQAGEGSSGSATGEQYGLASAEQWAVIVSSIERVKSYPRIARERGIEGVVHLRFRVRPEGEVDRVEIVRSSGYEILDTASVRTVYRAAPMPYVRGWIEVPIAYVLK